MILADIDNFKTINASFGRAAGDQVLIEVARRLRAAAKPDDLVARTEGGAFLIALPDTSSDDALLVADRMRRRIGETPYFVAGSRVEVTVSLGVCHAHADLCPTSGIEDLVDRADAALYTSKKDGRDRVSVARDPATA